MAFSFHLFVTCTNGRGNGPLKDLFSKILEVINSVREFHRHEFLHELGRKSHDLIISVLASSLKIERDSAIINEIMLT